MRIHLQVFIIIIVTFVFSRQQRSTTTPWPFMTCLPSPTDDVREAITVCTTILTTPASSTDPSVSRRRRMAQSEQQENQLTSNERHPYGWDFLNIASDPGGDVSRRQLKVEYPHKWSSFRVLRSATSSTVLVTEPMVEVLTPEENVLACVLWKLELVVPSGIKFGLLTRKAGIQRMDGKRKERLRASLGDCILLTPQDKRANVQMPVFAQCMMDSIKNEICPEYFG